MWRQRTVCLNSTEVLKKASRSPWLLLRCSYSESSNTKSKATPLQERRMIDRSRLHVKGGEGGSGCTSVRRSRQDRHGKPDGGSGGRGGDVILRCTSEVWDFRGLQHHVNATRGGPGASKSKIGSRGEDKVVRVPVGTVVHLVEGEIPSDVDQQSSESSDPWEMAGALSSDACSLDQHYKSSNASSLKVDHTESLKSLPSSRHRRHVKTPLSGGNQSSRKSTFESCPDPKTYSTQSRHQHEVFLPDDVDQDNFSSITTGDSLEMDQEMSQGDWEEEEEEEDEEIQYNVAELTEEGQQIIVACGGEGGLGSVSSGRSFRKAGGMLSGDLSRNIALEGLSGENHPTLGSGLPGSEAVLILELKTIADVGLVGLPNAGKSTLLGAISRAKPAVGHYAFTTLRPNIGKLNYDDISISVADIPGLIKGAHANRGLGHAFLRHIERTQVLAYVVDLAAALDGRKGIPPWEQLRDLIIELEYYREGLSGRPSLVVANKIDEAGAESVFKELQRRVKGVPIFPVCAILEEGVAELKTGLRLLMDGTETSTLGLDNILTD